VWGSGGDGDDDGSNDGDGELPEWLEELSEDGIDFGLIGDVAPYVTLRLVDNEATRALWPHAFELTVKVWLGFCFNDRANEAWCCVFVRFVQIPC
jgi:hypothetical protein